MSGAADNSLKHWLFDSADGTARLLRFRSGHSAPPSCLKFYGSGNKLLSAGEPSRLCPQSEGPLSSARVVDWQERHLQHLKLKSKAD